MDSEWMGRYRNLVAALVQHSNIVMKASSEKAEVSRGIFLNPNEWQILEYLVEHRDHTFSMIDISRFLGIPQSSFSKLVKTLQEYNLAEKYMAENNRKNVIIRPTEKAVEIYKKRNEEATKGLFQAFFEALDPLSDEAIDQFTKALLIENETLSAFSGKSQEIKLVKKE